MRLQSVIKEESNLDMLVDFLAEVLKNCQPYLNDIKNLPKYHEILYSGRSDKGSFFHSSVRTDRKPVDIFPEIHKDLDNAFNKRFGWKVRSAGLFCSGSISTADSYGIVYALFPVGKYKIVWSEEIADLYVRLNNSISNKDIDGVKRSNGIMQYFINRWENYNKTLKTPLSVAEIKAKITEDYNHYIDDIVSKYVSGKIRDAIYSGSEIVLGCESYYGFRWGTLKKPLNNFLDNYDNRYDLSKNDIRGLVSYGKDYKK